MGVYVVPPHYYFVMGGNRDNSAGSRFASGIAPGSPARLAPGIRHWMVGPGSGRRLRAGGEPRREAAFAVGATRQASLAGWRVGESHGVGHGPWTLPGQSCVSLVSRNLKAGCAAPHGNRAANMASGAALIRPGVRRTFPGIASALLAHPRVRETVFPVRHCNRFRAEGFLVRFCQCLRRRR